MNLSQIIGQFSILDLLALLVLLLALLAVIWLVGKFLNQNGKVKLEVNGKEVVDLEIASISLSKSTSALILRAIPREEKQENIIDLNIEDLPKVEDITLKTDSLI